LAYITVAVYRCIFNHFYVICPEFSEITRRLGLLRRSRSSTDTEFGRNRKLILCLTPPTEGFPWDDFHEILPGCQQMANVLYGVETLPKISIAWVGCTNVTDDRQTDDRQTDGR